ncbi:GLPGLI family protein [Dyadobacter pollutisoli]|uniref:GLPGLI family protein n=1 Tax=Dyadobacter pollutisoli TaxID=2910158 RepID=A0A9E8SMB4_9BACT|nr:GLPGLI family protein [Dyadobacter pollutisoli]WAC14565.1 GLPGLI family protein [Dyadobacter pollutisoli]
MKTYVILCLSMLLAATLPARSQSSGQISYEVTRKIDQSRLRFKINGEDVKVGDPNFPTDVPDSRTFGQKVLFAGNLVKENRDEQNMVKRMVVVEDRLSGGGPPRTTNMGNPFEEHIYVDLGTRKIITILIIGKEKEAKTYRSEKPLQPATGWQITDQTKKIAGHVCKKATVPFNKETYTVWFTTEIPVTYSPVHELTPETGLVLLIEGSQEQFRATKINTNAVDIKEVQPPSNAQNVTPEQLTDLRQKAMADFHQEMMNSGVVGGGGN